MRKIAWTPAVISGCFTAAAMIGAAATAVITAMRAPKYKDILALSSGNKAKAVIKTYWPTFTMLMLTETSVLLSYKLSMKALGALSAGVGYLIANRDAVAKEYKKLAGTEKYKAMKKEVTEQLAAKNIPTKTAGPNVEETGRGDQYVIDRCSGRRFRSDPADVERAVETFKTMYEEGQQDLPWNVLFQEYGISTSDWGEQYGVWDKEYQGDEELDFELDLVEGYVDEDGGVINESVLLVIPHFFLQPLCLW